MTETRNKQQSKGMLGRRGLAIVAVSIILLGAAAAGGLASGKAPPAGVIAPIDLPEGQDIANRLSIDGITGPGEWIFVESWSWGVVQTGDAGGGGGGGAGKANFQDLSVTSKLTNFSPKIGKACVSGMHIRKVILEDYSPAAKKGNDTLYLRITLEDVLVSSYQIGGQSGSGELPTEQISFSFAKVTFAYVGTDPAKSNSFAYDAKEGKFE